MPKVGNLEAAEGFQVVATQNPKEFVGTSLISEALRDRFELLTLDYQTFEDEEIHCRPAHGPDGYSPDSRGCVPHPEHPDSSACPQRRERAGCGQFSPDCGESAAERIP